MIINDFVAKYQRDFIEMVQSVSVTDIKASNIKMDEAITQIVNELVAVSERGNKLIFVGNGGSAAIASHMALDFWKNCGVKATAFNDSSLLTALANDYSYDEVFSKSIETFAERGDMLMAISSSGNSKNIVNASIAARKLGCTIATFSGFSKDNALIATGDWNFYLPSQSYGYCETIHAYLIHVILDAKLYCNEGIDIFHKNQKL